MVNSVNKHIVNKENRLFLIKYNISLCVLA
jgi:hypothetical protein